MRINSNPSLQHRTTLGLGGWAIAEAVIEEERDWDALSRLVQKEGVSCLVIGQGSNMLSLDGELPLILIRVDNGQQIDIVGQNKDQTIVQVGSGVTMFRFLGWLQKRRLSGLEALTGIPGSLGGAAAMNAGSYGSELGDILTRIQCWIPQQGLIWLDKEDLDIKYRSLSPKDIKGSWVITRVELNLKKKDPQRIKNDMRQHYLHKKSSQPVLARTCGCLFKNPTDFSISAGRLLDLCGFKGRSLGKIAFSSMHANFLVNLGGGKSSEALELINTARLKVKKEYGRDLELEVKIVGK